VSSLVDGAAAPPGDAAAASRTARVAVIAHRKKSLGGGLDELRRRVADEGVDKLLWYEVPKSRKAVKPARAAVADGAELVLIWGGDGMVQRCLAALAGTDVPVGIIPAGTANLLAGNLGIPQDLAEAVRVAFHGRRHRFDVGRLNGEHFAVMAGIGFDAEMISSADGAAKRRLGRLAYVWSGVRNTRGAGTGATITVDGTRWFRGRATCVLFGNVGTITGGIHAFDDARPDDGWLEVGVATATGPLQWARTLGRMAAGRSDRSPFVRITRGRRIDVKLAAPVRYELDGGARGRTSRLKARVLPAAITICVPAGRAAGGADRRSSG
jgi:YegS/Rv2252/BmrU family lipid kinase